MTGGSLAPPSQAGDTPSRPKRKAPESSATATAPSTSFAEDDEAADEELEREVADLARRILEHRRNAATRFLDATVSRITALRPAACPEVPSGEQSVSGTSHADVEQDMLEKLKILKSETDAYIAALPKVLTKMSKCDAALEKLEQLNVNIHPLYQRKR